MSRDRNDSDIIRVILRAIELEDRLHPHDTLWVTDIAQCLRKTYYQFKYPLKPEYRFKRSLIMGKAIHLWIEELLLKHKSELGVDIEVEVPVEARIGGMVVRGYADIILDNVLYEIKTVNHIPSKPYFEHQLQAGFYAYMLNLDKYCILYVSDYGSTVYCMETNRGILNVFRERVATLKRSLEEGKPPPRERSVLCNYCPYRRLCNRDKTLF